MNKRFDELVAPMREPRVKVGEAYPTESGGPFRCIFVEGGVAYCTAGGAAYQFNAADGAAINFEPGRGYDLILPPPPVVVSDAVMMAGIDTFNATPMDEFEADWRAAFAAAITAYLAEQGK